MKTARILSIFIILTLVLPACQAAQPTVQATSTQKTTVYLPPVYNQPPTQPATSVPTSVPQATPLPTSQTGFDGQRAWEDVNYQVSLGDRSVGMPAHDTMVKWMTSQLEQAGWKVEIQTATMLGHPIQNVVAYREGHESSSPWIVLGAHYDNRKIADQDPDPNKRNQYVPGANDGGSGVAVLLELARVLPQSYSGRLWLVFFDAEDNGNIPGWDWILGSRAFVQNLTTKPDMAVVIDMIGDANLNIYEEGNSNPEITKQIWDTAAQLGYQAQFIPQLKYNMEDDHTPFLQAGIPAVDLIDFDYPYWHTTSDTPDKVSASSLKIVGDTLLAWLNSNP